MNGRRSSSGAIGERRLGVVVLTYGESGVHLQLLDSLWSEGLSPREVLVVHNPSAPGEPDPVVPSGCELLRSERNLGYAGGMNLGIETMRAREVDLVLLLSHDARLRPGALVRLGQAAEAQPDYGVLAPALVLAETEVPFSWGGTTSRWGTAAHLKVRPSDDVEGVAECAWVDGGTMLVRSAALERTGGFDERFWGYCEESDLCLRIRRSGFRVGVVLDAVAEQEPGGPKRPGAWAYLLTRNGAEYARRVAGRRGAAVAELRALREVLLLLARAAVRTVRQRPGGSREMLVLAVGVARGAIDFLRGRWGPPPPGLPGMGDLHNA